MKALVRQTLKNKGAYKTVSTFEALGFTLDELENRLKSTLPEGFTWTDFLEGRLHIDHIRPVASFDFQSNIDQGFRQCWALSNLQLLTPEQNRAKRAHFTPSR